VEGDLVAGEEALAFESGQADDVDAGFFLKLPPSPRLEGVVDGGIVFFLFLVEYLANNHGGQFLLLRPLDFAWGYGGQLLISN